MEDLGEERFKQLESSKIKECATMHNAVLSPGGSIVYSVDAMELLADISTIVYLYADPIHIEKRINVSSRGIIGLKDKTFRQLFEERENLYKRFAHMTVDSARKAPAQIAAEILRMIPRSDT